MISITSSCHRLVLFGNLSGRERKKSACEELFRRAPGSFRPGWRIFVYERAISRARSGFKNANESYAPAGSSFSETIFDDPSSSSVTP